MRALQDPLLETKKDTKTINLIIKPRKGRSTHFYHFFLGVFFPLIEWYNDNNGKSYNKIFIRSFGTMNTLLKQMNYENIKIMYARVPRIICKRINESGMDSPKHYDIKRITKIKNIIVDHFSTEVNNYKNEIYEKSKKNTIVFIKREFQKNDSGANRRSIPNFEELVKRLKKSNNNVIDIALEEKPLAYQIALFKGADCVIAQHGAALTNLVFANKNVKVIEIIPHARVCMKSCYKILCRTLGIKHYTTIKQNGDHGKIPFKDIKNAIGRVTTPKLTQKNNNKPTVLKVSIQKKIK